MFAGLHIGFKFLSAKALSDLKSRDHLHIFPSWEPAAAAPVVVVEEDAATRKKRHNAPRRMAKLEDLIAEADAAIAAVDDDMVAAGADVGKAVDLQKRRDALQADLNGLWAEQTVVKFRIICIVFFSCFHKRQRTPGNS